jgi:hypothetical protein
LRWQAEPYACDVGAAGEPATLASFSSSRAAAVAKRRASRQQFDRASGQGQGQHPNSKGFHIILLTRWNLFKNKIEKSLAR